VKKHSAPANITFANAAMVLLYWDIGWMILDRQERAGWGTRVIDRLAADLRDAFPDMKGFSPRNLKYMRAFPAAWPKRAIVQEALAQITWRHNVTRIEKLKAEAYPAKYPDIVSRCRETIPALYPAIVAGFQGPTP